jgi:hypothetical protein
LAILFDVLMNPASVAEHITIYRGVHCQHLDLPSAACGEANPGDPNGIVTPELHNGGGFSDQSPFTSWTTRRDVAEYYAKRRAGGKGIILTKSVEHTDLVPSPDSMNEGEVFLKGKVVGCSVEEIPGLGPLRQKG